MLKLVRATLVAFLALAAPAALAQACGVIGTGIGGNGLNQTGGNIDIGNNGTINGTGITGSGNVLQPTGTLGTGSLTLPGLDPAGFPSFSGPNTNAASLAAGTYGRVTVPNNTTTFTTVGGTYFIDELSAGNNRNIVLAPGTYFINAINAGNGFHLTISPAGTVRIYIGTSVDIGNDYRLNAGGTVSGLQFFLYPGADFKIGNQSNANAANDFTGFIYAPGAGSEIDFGNNSDFRGNITTAGTIDIGNNTDITYTAADATEISTITTCPVVPPAHYAISYPAGSNGLTCQPLTVRITAHDAAHGAVVAPSGTTITLVTAPGGAGWALKSGGGALLAAPTRYVFSGTESFVELYLSQTTPATLDIDLVDGAGKADLDGDAGEDAPANFFDAGLVFDVPDHAAGQAQAVTISALRRDNAAVACVPAFANVTRAVSFWSGYLNPASGTLPVNVNGVAVAGTAPGTTFNLNFDGNGSAALGIGYDDVGGLQLNASTTFAGVDGVTRTLTGSDGFIVRPYGFKLQNLACAANFSPRADAFCPAGETVSGTITAVRLDSTQPNSLGAATPNFGRETPAQGVTLATDSLVMPAAGGTATAPAAVTTGAFAAGAASISFHWPQVGAFRYRPQIAGGSYLGSGTLTVAGGDASRDFAGTLGRFYPHRFVIANSGSASGHPACLLTYAGQPFPLGFTLTAVAKDLATATSNYGVIGYSPTLTAAALSLAAENLDDGVNRGVQIVTHPGGVAPALAPVWAAGAANFAAADHRFRRGSAEPPYGPWDALKLGIRLVDDSGDQVPLVGDFDAESTGACTNCNARSLIDMSLRYGRLRIANAYGSELTQLPVPLLAESWTGSGWAQNALDNCTALATPLPASAFSNYQRNLSAGETTATLASPLVAGNARLILSPPGAGNAGAVRITIDSPAWLDFQWDGVDQGGDSELFDDDPSALATFGVSRNNFIFMRENY